MINKKLQFKMNRETSICHRPMHALINDWSIFNVIETIFFIRYLFLFCFCFCLSFCSFYLISIPSFSHPTSCSCSLNSAARITKEIIINKNSFGKYSHQLRLASTSLRIKMKFVWETIFIYVHIFFLEIVGEQRELILASDFHTRTAM